MSRLIESTLTGKISKLLVEGEEPLKESSNNIDYILSQHDDLDMASDSDLGSDRYYHTLVTNMQEVKEFNYHSDYWGTADGYQEEAEELMRELEPYIGEVVEYTTDEGTYKVKIKGIYIDKQYNSHLKLAVDWIEEECDKTLKESLNDEIADFMAELDPYGYQDAYDGDETEKHEKAVADIENDKKAVIDYLQGIVDYEEATPEMTDRAAELLRELKQTNESENITPEELEREDAEDKKHNKKAIEDKIAQLKIAIQDGVSDDEKASMEKEIAELEDHLNECGYGRKHALEEGWSGTIKSGGALRKAIHDAGEDPTVEDCRAVLDCLKACCEEAKTLTNDEYYQNGFQSVIDDIECIYDDEDLELDNVDWELDGFYDWCDSANLWCDLGESNINEAYKADDGQYPPYRFEEADAEFIRNLIGPGFKVEIRNSSVDDAPNGTMDIALGSKWVSGFMSSTRELDNEIDKYFAEKNPELEVHRNNTGMTLWLGEKVEKKESNINESAEGIAEFWKNYDNGDIKIGDTFGNGITLLDANKEHDYILVDRGYEYVAAWAPELSGDNLVWGQGHYFDSKEDAEKYFNSKCNGSLNESSYDNDMCYAMETERRGYGPDQVIGDTCTVGELIDYLQGLDEDMRIVTSHDDGYTYGAIDPAYDIKEVPVNEDEDDEDEDFEESAKPKIEESVSVFASDGSTVDTQDAASVVVDNNTVSVTNGQTTVTITSTPSEPALDIPQEEPVEEVPAEELVPEEPVDEPIEEPVEEPVEDELVEADDEPEVSIVNGSNISTIKNQGKVYMIMIKDTEGNEKYWVCENYNASTNEADEASEYDNKEDADKDYFERVGLESTEN